MAALAPLARKTPLEAFHEAFTKRSLLYTTNIAVKSQRFIHRKERADVELERQPPRSHLFTVRLWLEELGNGESEWRGKVQHVTSGEVRYFRDWTMLIAFLQMLLPVPEADSETGGA